LVLNDNILLGEEDENDPCYAKVKSYIEPDEIKKDSVSQFQLRENYKANKKQYAEYLKQMEGINQQ
jgi:hypothetical protein